MTWNNTIRPGNGIRKFKMLICEVHCRSLIFVSTAHTTLFSHLALYQLAVMCFEGVGPKDCTPVQFQRPSREISLWSTFFFSLGRCLPNDASYCNHREGLARFRHSLCWVSCWQSLLPRLWCARIRSTSGKVAWVWDNSIFITLSPFSWWLSAASDTMHEPVMEAETALAFMYSRNSSPLYSMAKAYKWHSRASYHGSLESLGKCENRFTLQLIDWGESRELQERSERWTCLVSVQEKTCIKPFSLYDKHPKEAISTWVTKKKNVFWSPSLLV